MLEEFYEDWAIVHRDWLSRLRVTLLVELAGVQEQAGDLSAAIETLQQAVASDPVHEEAQGLLMRLLVRALQLISERLRLAYALPNVSQPPVILQPQSAMSPVMMAGLSSKQLSPLEMSVLARWTIRPALLSVLGVANVAI